MPLQPNFIERRLIKRGTIPATFLDGGMALFTVQALVAAMKLGVFDHLRDGPHDVETLADRMDASPEGVEILLRTLVPLGYLEHDGDTYRLTAMARRSLPEDELPAIGAFFETMAREGLDAAAAVRTGTDEGIIGWETVKSGEVGRGYQAFMRFQAADLVDPVVDAVTLPDEPGSMLDVGGSHGLFTVGFCEEHPGLEGTVLDWPIGLEAARQTLEERPELADRIDLVERDFEREELPDGYDVAFLGQIVHGLTPEGNRDLFEKLARATTDRGTVAILDQVTDPPTLGWLPVDPMDSTFSDGVAALLGFGLFLFSGGRAHDYDDLTTWLADAGFTDVSYTPVRESPGFSIVVGRKPGSATHR